MFYENRYETHRISKNESIKQQKQLIKKDYINKNNFHSKQLKSTNTLKKCFVAETINFMAKF